MPVRRVRAPAHCSGRVGGRQGGLGSTIPQIMSTRSSPKISPPRLRRTGNSPASPTPGKKKREFGTHMAKQGETKHIPTIILLMYAVIALYSELVRRLGGRWWEVSVYYLLGMAAFYAWHWLAHREIALLGSMHRLHMHHHLKNYPPGKFYGRTSKTNTELFGKPTPTMLDLMDPRSTTVNNLAHEGPLYGMMAGILVGGEKRLVDYKWAPAACLSPDSRNALNALNETLVFLPPRPRALSRGRVCLGSDYLTLALVLLGYVVRR